MKTTTAAKTEIEKGRIYWYCNENLDKVMYDMIHPILVKCVQTGSTVLPEEIADLFTLEIIEVNGLPRGILRFA